MPRDLFQEAGIAPPVASGGRDLFAEAGIAAPPPTNRTLGQQVADLGSALWQGARSTGRTLDASLRTVTNNRASVEQLSTEDAAAREQQPLAQRALVAEIARRKASDTDPGLISAIRNVGASMAANPAGSAQFVASQVPNTIVSLGAGLAGARGGAALGALTGPFAPVAVPVLGTAGFLGGMFLGNTALESGSKALEKASDGFTEQERSDALREGAIKGGVITGVDAVTLGVGGRVARSLNRASQAGVPSAGAGLARSSAQGVAQAPARAAPSLGTRAAQLGTGIALETVGEGTGEYLGELAATGKPDVYDAVLESAAGLSQSVPQAAWTMRQANRASTLPPAPPAARGPSPPRPSPARPIRARTEPILPLDGSGLAPRGGPDPLLPAPLAPESEARPAIPDSGTDPQAQPPEVTAPTTREASAPTTPEASAPTPPEAPAPTTPEPGAPSPELSAASAPEASTAALSPSPAAPQVSRDETATEDPTSSVSQGDATEALNGTPPSTTSLQNRDRSRLASVAQMQAIARAPDYMRLGPSRTPDSGAPMVFAVDDDLGAIPEASFGRSDVAVMADGQRVPFRYAVVSADQVEPSHRVDGSVNATFDSTVPGVLKALNNGRIAGLRGAYAQGKAALYQAELVSDVAQHGIDPAAVALTPQPILVRVYSQASNTANMAEKSQAQGLGMSPVELAQQDARLIDRGVLDAYTEGDVSAADNRDFVRAFMGKLAATGQDVATLMTAQGFLSPQGRTRIQAALTQAAYDDSELVTEMFDAIDTEIKGIGEALKAVAGSWAGMRDAARQGVIDPRQDITTHLMDTVALIKRARQERRSLYDLMRQPDLSTGDVAHPIVQELVKLFYSGEYLNRPVSKEKLAARLKTYVEQAMQTQPEPGFFGDGPSAIENLQSLGAPEGARSTVREQESRVYATREPHAGHDVPLDLFPETLGALQPQEGLFKRTPKGSANKGQGAGTTGAASAPPPSSTSPLATLALRPDPALPGIYHYSSQLVQVGERELPLAQVRTWSEATAALAAMGRFAVEHFDVLITDRQGKPLAVIGSFKGTTNAAAVYPNTVLAEALRIDGAAYAWGVHNHPSGIERLSNPDLRLNAALGDAFEPSSIQWMGLAAVGSERFEAADSQGTTVSDRIATPSGPPVRVPIAERIIVRNNALMPQISNSAQAQSVIPALAPANTPGVVFADAQQRITAFVPLSPQEAKVLRVDARFDRLINAATQAGAVNAFLFSPHKAYDNAAIANLGAALQKVDVSLLDVIDPGQPRSLLLTAGLPAFATTVQDLGRAKAQSRLGSAYAGYASVASSTPRVQTARRLAKLIDKLDAGSLSAEAFEAKVRSLAAELEGVAEAKADRRAQQTRVRGVDAVRERLIRAQRRNDLDPETVSFALWALDQNPALAQGLGISIVASRNDATAGEYNPAAQLMRLFKGSDARTTVVHEILHHTERMMPAPLQEGIRTAWSRAYTRALDVASAEERAALALIPQAMAGDAAAQKALRQAILEGPLNYDDHYALINPSEYWAVNASALLARRFDARDAVFKRLAVWMREMLAKVKGLLGLHSDAPLLRALNRLLDPEKTGEAEASFLSATMLGDAGEVEAKMRSQLKPEAQVAPKAQVAPEAQAAPETLSDLRRNTLDGSSPGSQPPGTPPPPGGPPPIPPPPPPPAFNAWQALRNRINNLISPAAIDALLYEFQDKYIDLKRVQQRIAALGGVIMDLNNAYMGEELYHKRVAHRTERFLKDELRPLLSGLHAAGIALADFERYLHARHAPEANAVLAQRNPSAEELEQLREEAGGNVERLEAALFEAQATGGATEALRQDLQVALLMQERLALAQPFRGTEAERLSLSGLSNEEAQAILAAVPQEQRASYALAASRIDAINERTLELLEAYGLMDAETLTAWRNTYQHYVPLHRDEAHPTSTAHPIGTGFSVKGAAARERVGSREAVTHILGHIAQQREAAITRGEKDRVTKKLYLLVAQHPDANFWQVDRPPTVRIVDSFTRTVRTIVDPNYRNLPYVVMLRMGGTDASITFNERNPEALRLAQSMRNLDIGDLHAAINLIAKGTRWFASINTQYNPIFGIINFARDLQSGLLNLSTTALAGDTRQVASGVWPALRAIYRSTRAERTGNRLAEGADEGQGQGETDWVALWNALQAAGGTTGYRDLFANAADRADALAAELARLDRGNASRAAHAILDWLSDYNETMENAVRLSAFKVARDKGLSTERAASLAKNLTVNFNRKGRQSREIGALYAFFNASVQGTVRMAQTLTGPLGRRIMLGGVTVGAINALVGMALMGGGAGEDGDETGDDNWAKIPEFVKEKNLIVPLSRTEYLSLPLPLGFHIFPNFGRLAVEMMAGGRENAPGHQLGKLLQVTLDAFNPLGGSQSLAQLVTPTVADPAVALAQNQDWTGRPIYRENHNPLDPQPGSALQKDAATPWSKAIAEALNRISGGNRYQPGALSPTPDQIDYLIGQLTGGVGREIGKLAQTLAAPFTADELPAHKVPLLGRLYGSTTGVSGESDLFYRNLKRLNAVENEYRGRIKADDAPEAYRQSEPLVEMVGTGNQAETIVSRLRALRREEQQREDKGWQERVREIDQQIEGVMREVNRGVGRSEGSSLK